MAATMLVGVLSGTLADPAAAQPVEREIAGLVEDASGGAIGGASLTAICGSVRRDQRSDGTGHFTLRGLPATPCVLDVRSDLFASQRLDVDLTRRSAFLRVHLALAGIQSEITVTPARGEQERTFDVPEPISVTTREEIEARPHHILAQVLQGDPASSSSRPPRRRALRSSAASAPSASSICSTACATTRRRTAPGRRSISAGYPPASCSGSKWSAARPPSSTAATRSAAR